MAGQRLRSWCVSLAVLGLIRAGMFVAPVATDQNPPPVGGVWKLNVEASTNPSGPPPPAPGSARSGRGATTGESLTQEETRRFNAMKTFFVTAPPMMGIRATATEFQIVYDPVKGPSFTHQTDNRSREHMSPAGPFEAKVKWDDGRLRREITTPDTLHVTEDYEVSADGRRLTVTVKADSRMVRNVLMVDVIRVYDRQQ